ncbi:hypothetical protein VXQ18_15640 [Brucella abortus]|nr:hypothetical protein [Brucella abortus]
MRPHHAMELANEPDHAQGESWPLLAGRTVVLKPRQPAPMSAMLAEAPGRSGRACRKVFSTSSMAWRSGRGELLSQHPEVDMMIGYRLDARRNGAFLSRAAAATVKRVSLELWRKSPTSSSPIAIWKVISRSLAHCFREYRPVLQRTDTYAGGTLGL